MKPEMNDLDLTTREAQYALKLLFAYQNFMRTTLLPRDGDHETNVAAYKRALKEKWEQYTEAKELIPKK